MPLDKIIVQKYKRCLRRMWPITKHIYKLSIYYFLKFILNLFAKETVPLRPYFYSYGYCHPAPQPPECWPSSSQDSIWTHFKDLLRIYSLDSHLWHCISLLYKHWPCLLVLMCSVQYLLLLKGICDRGCSTELLSWGEIFPPTLMCDGVTLVTSSFQPVRIQRHKIHFQHH